MTRRDLIAALSATTVATGSAAHAADPQPPQRTKYELTPDSERQPDVPQGKVTKFQWTSQVYPGTERDCWLYVPAQYTPDKPACVMVFQDGGGFQDNGGGYRVPVVFDNLIHKKEMPVTIGVFLNPGVVPAPDPNAQLSRYNRSYEYDALSDQYVRFLVSEILPEVGKQYKLTDDPNGRAICGASSGGICAFTAAWERPDYFRKVLSFIGSFTDLRGGNTYPDLIRKMEPRPIRVFLQDGSNDLDIYSGSWFIGNNDVAAALRFAGYDYQYVVGDGGHSGEHGRAILPDALRWLWRDYPGVESKVKAETPAPSRQPVVGFLAPGKDWQEIATKGVRDSALAADPAGNVYAYSLPANALLRIAPDSNVTTFREKVPPVSALTFGADGALYVAHADKKRRLVSYDAGGKEILVAENAPAVSLARTHAGKLYAADENGATWLQEEKGKRRTVANVGNARHLALTPDQSLLLLCPGLAGGKFVSSAQIKPDGSLAHLQEYFDLRYHYGAVGTGAGPMATDANGWLYVATYDGIQILDQAGRVNAILDYPNPYAGTARYEPRHPIVITGLTFGGPGNASLYITYGSRLYRRELKARGVLPCEPPIKPPAPRL
jgi:gluconolactonase